MVDRPCPNTRSGNHVWVNREPAPRVVCLGCGWAYGSTEASDG